jgi:5'-3' exonuclease
MLDSTSSIIKYYPTDFQQDYIGKRKYWQSIPLLPPLNIKAIYDEYKKIFESKELNEMEKNKNKPQPIHLFGL